MTPLDSWLLMVAYVTVCALAVLWLAREVDR